MPVQGGQGVVIKGVGLIGLFEGNRKEYDTQRTIRQEVEEWLVRRI
jgi:hypothetical protein